MDVKELEARALFDKEFGFIKDLNLVDEYVKVRLKLSSLSATKRSKLIAYVNIRYQSEEKFKEMIDNLDKDINSKLAKKNEGTNNSGYSH